MSETLSYLANGFAVALTFQNISAAAIGAVLGIIVGAMPGIGSLAGVALLLPLTFNFNPTTAIIMLGALYYSNMFGGSYSAILLNIPGDSPAVMTTLDGYPLAQQGKAGKALLTANFSSFYGGLIGMIILTFTGPALANIGLQFGPPEMVAVLLVAMTSISWLVGESPVKGVITTLLGIMIACIGMDAVVGTPRYSFGNVYLLGGIPFTPLVIGAFGFSQVISMMSSRGARDIVKADLTIKSSMLSKEELKRILPPATRSGFLGTVIGILPGSGATTASFMCYGIQKQAFKSKVPLGKGAVEGIAACESANNAAAAGAFAPLLALGIPGSGTTAVLLGGLVMWGLNPGPLLFSTNPDFAWGLIASLFLANFITLFMGLLIIPFLMRIISVPPTLMIPIITTVCIVGSYSTSNSMYGVVVMIIAGVVGYVLDKYKYPAAPLLLAMVLSPALETYLRRSFITSKGSPMIFFEKPISAVLMSLFLIIILWPTIRTVYRKISTKKA